MARTYDDILLEAWDRKCHPNAARAPGRPSEWGEPLRSIVFEAMRLAIFEKSPCYVPQHAPPADPPFKPYPVTPLLEIGRYYLTRDGNTVGPLASQAFSHNNKWPFYIAGIGSLDSKGRYRGDVEDGRDLLTMLPPKDWRDVPVTAGMLLEALKPEPTHYDPLCRRPKRPDEFAADLQAAAEKA